MINCYQCDIQPVLRNGASGMYYECPKCRFHSGRGPWHSDELAVLSWEQSNIPHETFQESQEILGLMPDGYAKTA